MSDTSLTPNAASTAATRYANTAAPEQSELSLLDLVLPLLSAWKWIIGSAALTGLVALGMTYFIAPRYTAITRIMPPAQSSQSSAAALLSSLGSLGAVAAQSGAIKNPGDQYVSLLRSRSVQDSMVDRFGLQERYQAKFRVKARVQLEAFSQIASSSRDGIITIAVEDTDPKLAASMANGYVEELSKVLQRLSLSEAQARRKFFAEQVAQAKTGLDRADAALKASGGPGIDALKSNPTLAVGTLAQTKAQLTTVELRLQSMKNFMNDTAPEYRQLVHEASVLRAQLARMERETNAGDSSEYFERFRTFKYNESLYELLVRQYESARIDESREGNVMQLLDSAEVPELKSSPKRLSIASLAAILVGLLATAIVWARHFGLVPSRLRARMAQSGQTA